MYRNCQSYIHVHVLKFCLTDQSLSKNGGKYFPAGKKERCTTVDRGKFNLLVLKTIHTYNRGQLESLLGGAKRGGSGTKYEAKCQYPDGWGFVGGRSSRWGRFKPNTLWGEYVYIFLRGRQPSDIFIFMNKPRYSMIFLHPVPEAWQFKN